jgi:hypothetical protein
VQSDRRNLRKIKEVVASTTVNIMNPLREGKSLLVLDLDYSRHRLNAPVPRTHHLSAILDTKPLTSGTLPPSMCARPHLHEFLEGDRIGTIRPSLFSSSASFSRLPLLRYLHLVSNLLDMVRNEIS